jgi:hypothetical protein
MYGDEAASLVVPCIALENNIPEFVSNIQNNTEKDILGSNLLEMSSKFWPEDILKKITARKSQKGYK